MKRISIISILCFCFVTIQAQDKISVYIQKVRIDAGVVAFNTTITNNNIGTIIIPIESFTDDYGNNINGGGSYLSLNAYDINNNKLSYKSNNLYFQYNPDYPLLNSKNRIILKKGESINRIDKASYSEGIRGFLENECTCCQFFDIKLHVKFFYTTNNSWYEKDIISNRISIK